MSAARWGAIFGVLFVAGLLAGFVAFDLPGHDDGDDRVTAFYADGGNRARVMLGAACFGVAGLSFLGFAACLAAVTTSRDRDGHLASLILAGATAFMVLLFAAAAAQVPTYALSIDAFDEPESQLTRATIPHIGWSLMLFAFLAAGLVCACASQAILRSGTLPRWLAYTGFATAALMVVAIFFMPIFALPLWTLAAAVALWRVDQSSPGQEPIANRQQLD